MNSKDFFRKAFYWECPNCGHSHNESAPVPEHNMEERSAYREHDLDISLFAATPDQVDCDNCGHSFPAVAEETVAYWSDKPIVLQAPEDLVAVLTGHIDPIILHPALRWECECGRTNFARVTVSTPEVGETVEVAEGDRRVVFRSELHPPTSVECTACQMLYEFDYEV